MQDHVIKGLYEFMEESSSLYIPTLSSLVATDIVEVVHHVISQDHVIIWSCDFMGRSQSNEVTIPPSFVL